MLFVYPLSFSRFTWDKLVLKQFYSPSLTFDSGWLFLLDGFASAFVLGWYALLTATIARL
jgi:hypothetical protein